MGDRSFTGKFAAIVQLNEAVNHLPWKVEAAIGPFPGWAHLGRIPMLNKSTPVEKFHAGFTLLVQPD